jgi:hypothetical protein
MMPPSQMPKADAQRGADSDAGSVGDEGELRGTDGVAVPEGDIGARRGGAVAGRAVQVHVDIGRIQLQKRRLTCENVF